MPLTRRNVKPGSIFKYKDTAEPGVAGIWFWAKEYGKKLPKSPDGARIEQSADIPRPGLLDAEIELWEPEPVSNEYGEVSP